ncbi:MAG: glycosyltransferase family 2 protein [Nanoarchaeota archaeon]
MKPLNVSIVLPLFNPHKEILSQVLKAIDSQDYLGKVEVLQIDEKAGFSQQMNRGIRKAKHEIVIMLPQDCMPATNDWLSNLIAPFEDIEVVATVSQIQLPDRLWEPMGIFAKALMMREKGVIVSLLDGKGGAFRKKVMEQIGLFDEKTFRTAGEDFDTYVKIKRLGKIAYPQARILHLHPTAFVKRLRKDYQYSNGYGALVSIYGKEMPRWYVGVFKATPVLGVFAFAATYPFKKGISLYLPYLCTIFFSHIFYVYGFWKGFLMKRQTV